MQDRDLYRSSLKLFDFDQDRWLSRGLEEYFSSLISLGADRHLKDGFAELLFIEVLDSVEILASGKRERLAALFSNLGFHFGVFISVFIQIDRLIVAGRERRARLGGFLRRFLGQD